MSRAVRTAAIAALVVAFVGFSALVKVQRWEHALGAGRLQPGAPAPPLELPNLQGETIELRSTVAGRRLVVVAFWATWCGPCRTELEELARLYEKHAAEGLEVLTVSIDRDTEEARRYAEQMELPFAVLLDPERKTLERFGVQALPTSVLVGPEGAVLRAVQGLRSSLPAQIEYHLREPPSDG